MTAPDPSARGPRCEDALAVRFGDVLTRTDGTRWVFVGWGENSAGREAIVVREMQPGEHRSRVSPRIYMCSYVGTFLSKFPATPLRPQGLSWRRERAEADSRPPDVLGGETGQ